MRSLSRYQKNLQALSDLIRFALGVDVFFVDQKMVAVAGTGPYRMNIGTQRPRDSYVDITLHHGDGTVVTQPRYTEQCYRCEYRSLCPYSMVMCRPITEGNQIFGLIGFLGFSREQRQAMINRSSILAQVSQKLEYIWDTEDLGLDRFFNHPGTLKLLETFDEGLVLTNRKKKIISMNKRAEQLIAAGRIIKLDETIVSTQDLLRPIDVAKQYQAKDYTIKEGENPAGRMFVISEQRKDANFWHGCPLSTPAITTIVGSSPAMASLRQKAAYVAESDSIVLLIGETGAGKELLARFIHQSGPRWSGPFETVNCAAIPEGLFESEIFGYAPGAFTGANRKGHVGKFEAAHKGTIFLDEVGRLSLANQTKILRVLEEKQVQRLGDNGSTGIDVRVMAATNVDLDQAVRETRFLPDLYYRLMVIPLTVPPLRERREDIPLLIEYFVLQLKEAVPSNEFQGFTGEAMLHLKNYSWPGNVRELKNMVEYVMNLVRGRRVEVCDLPAAMNKKAHRRHVKEESLAVLEQERIRQALKTHGYSTEGKKRAAMSLGISLSTLYRRLALERDLLDQLSLTSS